MKKMSYSLPSVWWLMDIGSFRNSAWSSRCPRGAFRTGRLPLRRTALPPGASSVHRDQSQRCRATRLHRARCCLQILRHTGCKYSSKTELEKTGCNKYKNKYPAVNVRRSEVGYSVKASWSREGWMRWRPAERRINWFTISRRKLAERL